MYFWKIDRLKNELKSGSLTQKDEFLYTLFWVVIYEFLLNLISFFPDDSPSSGYEYISDIVDIVITVAGVYYIYIKNGASSGKEFMKRYFSLSFVISIRLVVIALPVLFILGIGFAVAEEYLNYTDSLVDIISTLFTLIFEIIYIYLVSKHIADVAANSN